VFRFSVGDLRMIMKDYCKEFVECWIIFSLMSISISNKVIVYNAENRT